LVPSNHELSFFLGFESIEFYFLLSLLQHVRALLSFTLLSGFPSLSHVLLAIGAHMLLAIGGGWSGLWNLI
jgi:hypothetical protein